MKIKRMLSRNKYSGLVLPLVATIVVFIFLIGIAVLKVGFGGRYIAAMTSTQIAARSAADAGLTLAIHEMNKKLLVKPWDNSTLPSAADVRLPNSRAYYSYTVTGDPAEFIIASTGRSDRETRNVFAMTRRTSFWSYAIAVDDTITLRSSMVLDVWPEDSTFTPTIATNSTEPGAVTLAPNTNIPGDIVVGPCPDADSVVNTKKTSTINGDVYAAASQIEFPPVTVPGGLPSLIWPDEPNGMTITTDRAYLNPVVLGNKVRVSIVGDVTMYVPNNMRLNNTAELYIAAGSSLNLYLGGWFIADNGSRITNASQDSRNLRIYGTETCTQIIIRNSGEFWGAVYAPSANLEINNSGKMYGSFIGNSFEMDNSGEFYYDTRLYDFDPTGQLSFFQVERWWER